jgi:hypothetical protein
MKIAIVQNVMSQYAVIYHMEKGLIQAFNGLGIEVNFSQPDCRSYEQLYQLFEREKVACTLSINQVLGRAVYYDAFFVPHVLISIDALFWHSIPDVIAPHVICCFPDFESVAYLKKVYQKEAIYFPHACSLQKAPYLVDRKKTIPFLLPASYLDDEAEYSFWRKEWGTQVAQTLVDEAQKFLSDKNRSFFETAYEVYENSILPLVLKDSHEIQMHFFLSFERFIRGLDRNSLLETLRGETVHMAMREDSLLRYRKRHPQVNFVFEGLKNFEEVLDLFSQTKCVLNTLPPSFRQSLHERVLYALAFGCTLYSTTMSSLPNWMREVKMVSFYDQGDLFPSCVDPNLFHKAWQWIEKEHTWEVRVQTVFQEIFKQADLIRKFGQEDDPFAQFRSIDLFRNS